MAGPATPKLDLPSGRFDALYVHVPFCFHKCHYCDFYSITRQTPERMGAFVDRVLAEGRRWVESGQAFRFRTVFFGGGTPTLLPVDPMARLLGGLREMFDWSAVDECTVEANPATVDEAYCRMLIAAGVNRISFGAQSFDRADLDLLERHHEPADVARSLDGARRAGFRRVNLDLIFAVPGQSLASWMNTLEAAVALGPDHLSCYALTYEPNTPITVRKRLGRLTAAEESLEVRMLHDTRDRLAAEGFEPYEISNFASPGQACRHNLNYWRGGNYLGLGPSAASHLDGHRWKNRPHLGEWEKAVDAGELPVIEYESLTPRQRAGELAMLMLRLGEGIDFERIAKLTGVGFDTFSATVGRMRGLKMLGPDGAKLTPRGIEVADAVAAEFLTD